MIRRCSDRDLEVICSIINEGAKAYTRVIPADCLSEPYMSFEELAHETDAGVEFWGYEEDGKLTAVMAFSAFRT